MTEEQQIIEKLHGVAARLTGNRELQKDLLQVMCIHLVRVETDRPGRTQSWYLQRCHFCARNYLRHGRSIDSIKRGHNRHPLGHDDSNNECCWSCADAVDPIDLRSELIAP